MSTRLSLLLVLATLSHNQGNKSDSSYLSRAFEHRNPLKSSPVSHSLLLSDSVVIMSSCSFLVFPLSVSLVL